MPLMNSAMLADYCGVTRASVSNWVISGRIKPCFTEGPYVFTDDEVKRFMRDGWKRMRPAGGVKASARRAGGKRRG